MINKLKKILLAHDDFLVTAHLDPDGDAISSVIIISYILKKLGKRYIPFLVDTVPKRFKFLSPVEEIKSTYKGSFNTLIVLDTPSLERTGIDFKGDKFIVNIDHHPSNRNFGNLNWVAPERTAACLMAYELMRAFDIELSKEIAEVLYAGMFTETGGFLNSNLTIEVFKTVVNIFETGVDLSKIGLMLEQWTPVMLRFLKRVLGTLTIRNGIAYIYIEQSMLEEFGRDLISDAGRFLKFVVGLPDVKVVLLFKDFGEYVKISFRSPMGLDVNRLASLFGGGGHKSAAGAKLDGRLKNVIEKVIDVTEDFIAGRTSYK